MSESRIEEILDAAYQCFTRHGARRTTMDDIAAQAGMSRPAVYQYMRNKDEVFNQLADRLFQRALEQARLAAHAPGDRLSRLFGVLSCKLELVLRLWSDSPHHAAELIGEGSRISRQQEAAYQEGMQALLTEILNGVPDAKEIAVLLLALTRGLEADLADPDLARKRLRQAVTIFAAGLTTQTKTSRRKS